MYSFRFLNRSLILFHQFKNPISLKDYALIHIFAVLTVIILNENTLVEGNNVAQYILFNRGRKERKTEHSMTNG